jgi:hypothetical protein
LLLFYLQESLLRLEVVGPGFTDLLAFENKFRLSAYKAWLNALQNGIGEDIFLAEAQKQQRERRAVASSRRRREAAAGTSTSTDAAGSDRDDYYWNYYVADREGRYDINSRSR